MHLLFSEKKAVLSTSRPNRRRTIRPVRHAWAAMTPIATTQNMWETYGELEEEAAKARAFGDKVGAPIFLPGELTFDAA